MLAGYLTSGIEIYDIHVKITKKAKKVRTIDYEGE